MYIYHINNIEDSFLEFILKFQSYVLIKNKKKIWRKYLNDCTCKMNRKICDSLSYFSEIW